MAAAKSSGPQLIAKLAVGTELGGWVGDTRISLLENIDKLGSISQAAKAVSISYKTAWDAVDEMNNLAEQPLVASTIGGRQGGGTRLTEYGAQLVAMYRALAEEYQEALDRVTQRLGTAGPADVDSFRTLLRRMSMRTSARNRFVGKVVGLRADDVDYEVELRLPNGSPLTAIITRESADNLRIAIGGEVHALVKASSIMLLTDPSIRISAQNRMACRVVHIHDSGVSAEVVLALDANITLAAVVTRDSVTTLGLKPESPVYAVFQASSVILAVLG